jgi:hypothetical protein
MPHEPPTPDTVAAMAQAAGVSLDAATTARVARAVAPTSARVAQGDIAVSFEVEPATFRAVARRGGHR